jgi:hypothetical protein
LRQFRAYGFDGDFAAAPKLFRINDSAASGSALA